MNPAEAEYAALTHIKELYENEDMKEIKAQIENIVGLDYTEMLERLEELSDKINF